MPKKRNKTVENVFELEHGKTVDLRPPNATKSGWRMIGSRLESRHTADVPPTIC